MLVEQRLIRNSARIACDHLYIDVASELHNAAGTLRRAESFLQSIRKQYIMP